MADKTFKVGDRVTLPKLGRAGKIHKIITERLKNTPETQVTEYIVSLDGFPELVKAYESELEPERK